MTALVTNNLPFVAAASNGISTLRELILELAIQGRLLKRERAAPSWQMLKLPEVATYRIGKTPPSKEARYWDDAGIPWVSISDMEHFTVLTETSRGVSKDVASETFKYPPVPAGSLLMSFKLTVGKICVLGVDGYHNEAIISLQPKEGVLRDYLMRVLPSIARAGKTKDALMGATLNSASLAELIIPLPTIEEQVRIVAKVDELMALCDRLEADQADAEAAHAQLVQALLNSLTQATGPADFSTSWQRLSEHFHTLFTTEASIDALKQTVLQLAVMGCLSPTDASRTARDVPLIGSCLVPSHWLMKKLQDVAAEIVDCPHSTPKWTSTGEICVRTSQFRPGHLDLTESRFVAYDTYLERIQRLTPVEGDILYSREGGILGVACRIPANVRLCLGQRMMLIRPGNDIDGRFLELVLNAPLITRLATKLTTGGAAPRVNVSTVKAYPVPLPPLSEQHRIVAKVDELMALCDQLKTQLTDARQNHAQLATVLVEQAVAA